MSDIEKKIGKYLQENREELKREKGLMLHDDHKAPMSRRELLACGFYSSAYSIALPSAASLLFASKEASASAASCVLTSTLKGVPVLQLHRSGGAMLNGTGLFGAMAPGGDTFNYSPVGRGAKDSDYHAFGLHPDFHPTKAGMGLVSFGGHAVSPYSYFLEGARRALGNQFNQVMAKLTTVSFAARSSDDSPGNSLGMTTFAANLRGQADFPIVSNSSGTDQTGVHAVQAFNSFVRADVLPNTSDVSKLAATGLESSNLDLRKKYLSALFNLVGPRISGKEARAISGCSQAAAREKLTKFGSTMDAFLLDANVAAIFDPANGAERHLGTICYMLRNGLASTAAANYGGYDYHDSTVGWLAKDIRYAVLQAKVLAYFHAVGSPIIIVATSDGATYSSNTSAPVTETFNGVTEERDVATPTGDGGKNSGVAIFALAGSASERIDPAFYQSGWLQPNGGVGSSPIGYDEQNRNLAVAKTIENTMIRLSGNKPLAKDFQQASGGSRFPSALDNSVPIKKS